MTFNSASAQGPQSVVGRIRMLAGQGDSLVARALADSLARAASASSEAQAEGLYWRGLLAPTPRERRVDLARVTVEFPLTTTAGDALYRLAELNISAGDRALARRQLQRVLRDYGSSPTANDAALELGQLLLAAGDGREGCAALDSALQWTAAEQVERRNRILYLRRPCANLLIDQPTDSVPAVEGRAANGTPGTTTRMWSAQVGAFASRAEADRVVTRLVTRGYEARVTPERPFRVRIGKFSKRADAAALVEKLKREKTAAILVEAERS